jgi:hypothetical protein
VRQVTIVLDSQASAKLVELARRQFRAPRQQAAALLVDAIERASRDEDERRSNADAQNQPTDIRRATNGWSEP